MKNNHFQEDGFDSSSYFGVCATYTHLRHCEAQLNMQLRSTQQSTTASPKQSPYGMLRISSGQGDCFVASHDFIATSFDCVPASPMQIATNVPKNQINLENAPRNDESQQYSAFGLWQKQNSRMTHIETQGEHL